METNNIFNKHEFHVGRLITGSKSSYRENHPNDLIIFNANILIQSKGKIWHGDLNITKDAKILQRICNEINEKMIIVSEMLCRFGMEEKSYSEIEKNARVIFKPKSKNYKKAVIDGFDVVENGNMSIIVGRIKKYNKIKI